MAESGQLTIVSAGVARLADLGVRCGLDRRQILDEARIDPALLEQPDVRLPVDAFARLWRVLAQRLPDRVLALDWLAGFKPSDLGMLGYVLAHAANLGEAIEALTRYHRLLNQGLSPHLERAASIAWVRLSLTPALLAAQHADQMLARIDASKSVSHETARRLAERLAAGEPAQAAIAKQMGMSERTLQRRLQSEGTSFNRLLEDARRSIAMGYLADRKLAAYEVSFLLGYAEPATFFRAFKRWTGQTPQQYRASVA
jgi:AraC-like DNA-binding protein